jgi:hypothetical protein
MKGSATIVLHTSEMFGLHTAIVQTIKEGQPVSGFSTFIRLETCYQVLIVFTFGAYRRHSISQLDNADAFCHFCTATEK